MIAKSGVNSCVVNSRIFCSQKAYKTKSGYTLKIYENMPEELHTNLKQISKKPFRFNQIAIKIQGWPKKIAPLDKVP